jgi:hypothetical protein
VLDAAPPATLFDGIARHTCGGLNFTLEGDAIADGHLTEVQQ